MATTAARDLRGPVSSLSLEDAIAAGRTGRASLRSLDALCTRTTAAYDSLALGLAPGTAVTSSPPPGLPPSRATPSPVAAGSEPFSPTDPLFDVLSLTQDYIQLVSAGFVRAALRLKQEVVAPVHAAQAHQQATHRAQVAFARQLIDKLRTASGEYRQQEQQARRRSVSAPETSEQLAAALREFRRRTRQHGDGIEHVCQELRAAEQTRRVSVLATLATLVAIERERLSSLHRCLDTLQDAINHCERAQGVAAPDPEPQHGEAVEEGAAAAGAASGAASGEACPAPEPVADDEGGAATDSPVVTADAVGCAMAAMVQSWFSPAATGRAGGELPSPTPTPTPTPTTASPPPLPPSRSLPALRTQHDAVQWARRVFGAADGRQAYIRALNTQRCLDTELAGGLDDMAAVTGVFLDACQRHDDVDAALKLMLMAETFSEPPARAASTPPAATTITPPAAPDTSSLPRELLPGPPPPPPPPPTAPLPLTPSVERRGIVAGLPATPATPRTPLVTSPIATPSSAAVEPSSTPATSPVRVFTFPDAGGAAGGGGGAAASPRAPADGGAAGTFLRTRVCGHPVWRDLAFWKEAFFRLVAHDCRARRLSSPQSRLSDAEDDQRNTIFGHLASFTLSLRSFGVPLPDVQRLVREVSAVYRLTVADQRMLLQAVGE